MLGNDKTPIQPTTGYSEFAAIGYQSKCKNLVCGDVCNLIDRNTSVSCIDEDESSEPHQNNDRIHSAHYLLMEGRGYKDLMEVLSDC